DGARRRQRFTPDLSVARRDADAVAKLLRGAIGAGRSRAEVAGGPEVYKASGVSLCDLRTGSGGRARAFALSVLEYLGSGCAVPRCLVDLRAPSGRCGRSDSGRGCEAR